MINEKQILSLFLARGIGISIINRVLDIYQSRNSNSFDLTSTNADDIAKMFAIKYELAIEVQKTTTKAEELLNELQEQSIKILIKGSPEYPKRLEKVLGSKAPPVLFAKGNLQLLKQKGVGFCGSRKASEKGICVAKDCATKLAQQGINIISGYAKGVDLAAHKAALESDGSTTFVLAEGILHFRLKREIKELAKNGNFVVVSEFSPKLPWNARNAMQRNKTICGLSNALIIIESGIKGGTFEAGKTALELKRPLFVASYAQPAVSAEGNSYFITHGARALGKKNGEPYLDDLFRAVESDINSKPEEKQPILKGLYS